MGQHLGGGQQQRLLDVFRPALGGGVKLAHGVDLVVKELAPHRLIHQGGEHVQDAAPQGELAHALHLAAAGVPGGQQPLRQFPQVHPLPQAQPDGQAGQKLRRQGPGQQGVGGGHGYGRPPPGQGVQRRQAAPLPLPGAHRPGPQAPLPAQQQHRLHAGGGAQVTRQGPGLPLVAAEEHRRPARSAGDGRAHAGSLHGLEAGDRRGAAALLHPADQLRHLREGLQLSQKLFHACFPKSQKFPDRQLKSFMALWHPCSITHSAARTARSKLS